MLNYSLTPKFIIITIPIMLKITALWGLGIGVGGVLFHLHFLFYAFGLDLNFDDALGLKQ